MCSYIKKKQQNWAEERDIKTFTKPNYFKLEIWCHKMAVLMARDAEKQQDLTLLLHIRTETNI